MDSQIIDENARKEDFEYIDKIIRLVCSLNDMPSRYSASFQISIFNLEGKRIKFSFIISKKEEYKNVDDSGRTIFASFFYEEQEFKEVFVQSIRACLLDGGLRDFVKNKLANDPILKDDVEEIRIALRNEF